MNFQICPISGPDRVALFQVRVEHLWKSPSENLNENSFRQRDVMAVMSTDAGHFLLVLNGDELTTIREVCRSENSDFIGIYPRDKVAEEIRSQLAQRQKGISKKAVFC